jgi:hypothetical protein
MSCRCVVARFHLIRRLSVALVLSPQFETASECSQRECLEEGGVEGDIVCELDPIEFASKKGKLSRMRSFLMRVHTCHLHWSEELKRRRRWVPYAQVEAIMQREETRTLWKNAQQALQQHGFMDSQGRAVLNPASADLPAAAATTASAAGST